MNKKNKFSSSLNPQQPNKNDDLKVLPLREEQLKDIQSILEQRRKAEIDFPILKANEQSEWLDNLLNEINHFISEFRNKIEDAAVKVVARKWLIQSQTPTEYTFYITEFFNRKIIQDFFADGKDFTVGGFRNVRHQTAIAYIKQLNDLPEPIKEEMIICYAAFISYLNQISYGWFKLVDTKYKMSPDASLQALSFAEWRSFIDVLYKINTRDELIARLILQGTVRISEALSLTINQIDFLKNTIHFKQKNKVICIDYDANFIKELKEYIENTTTHRKDSPLVFVTSNGKPVTRSRLNFSFNQASQQAKIKKVSPESLRSTRIILKQQGYKDAAIMESKKSCITKNKEQT